MNPKPFLPLALVLAAGCSVFAQEEPRSIAPDVTSILINWSWQAENGDTTVRDFCMLEFALPAEALAGAYGFRLEGIEVKDNHGRIYNASSFPVSAGEQSLHRDYRLLRQEGDEEAAPRFRVRIEDAKRDVDYFTVAGRLDAVFPSRDPNSIQEFSTLDWQSLYEALLPYGVHLVFAAQGRSLMEQMANLGSMSPEGQESLNNFLEAYGMYLEEPLFPENTNLLLDDPDKQVLKVETIGPDGQPIPYKDRRAYSQGALHLQQLYDAPLGGQERVRVVVATEENQVSLPVRMERVVLPW